MAIFQNPLWGFELTYPDEWIRKSHADTDGFAKDIEAFDQAWLEQNRKVGTVSEQAAHILVRGEWNGRREPIAPLWNQHITKLSIMLGAKKLGAAPFSIGGAKGFEAEIQLPRRQNRRLWAGILARGTVILHFMVSHPKEERADFEPQATKIISSLQFLDRVNNLSVNEKGLPLPPRYVPVNPASLVPDAQNNDSWQAYIGNSDIGALQAFYFRELPQHAWEISEFIPFPNHVGVDFARLRIHKGNLNATLGILPTAEKKPQGKIVLKYESVLRS